MTLYTNRLNLSVNNQFSVLYDYTPLSILQAGSVTDASPMATRLCLACTAPLNQIHTNYFKRYK